MNRKNYTRSQIIAVNALLCALVLTFAFFPVQIGVLSLAVIPIIAIIVSAETMGVVNGMLTGLFFGAVSLLNHLVRPGALSFAFYNPLVSILPRILIGVSAFYTAKGVSRLFPGLPRLFPNAVGALAGVLTNTVGVLGLILAFYHGRPLGSGGSAINTEWLAGIILTNSILEAVVCTVLTPPIVVAVKKTCELSLRKKPQ